MRVHGWLLTVAVLLGPGLAPAGIITTEVDVELIMLVDASGTIDDAEHALIRDEIAAGLRDASDSLPAGGVAFNLVYWANGQMTSALTPSGDPGMQDMPLGWNLITTPAEADELATRIEGTVRDFDPDPLSTDPVGGLTSVASAINGAVPMFGMNDFSSSNLVIDLVGDGTENFQISSVPIVELQIDLGGGSGLILPIDTPWGADLQAVADANAAGVVVNGLPIRPQAFDPPMNANEETELKDSQRVSRRLLAQFFSTDGIDAEADPNSPFNQDFDADQRAAIIGALENFEADLIASLGLEQDELTYHEWFYRDFATGGEGSFVEIAENNGDIRRAVATKLRREFGLPEPGAAWLIALGMGALLRQRGRR